VSPVTNEVGFYIPEEDILHSHRRENLKSDAVKKVVTLHQPSTSFTENSMS
jgi:hypothetical protein